MNPPLQNFVAVALPIMVTLVATIWIAQWSQNKRFEDLNRRFDDLKGDINRRFDEVNRRFDEVTARLTRIEAKLDNHETRPGPARKMQFHRPHLAPAYEHIV